MSASYYLLLAWVSMGLYRQGCSTIVKYSRRLFPKTFIKKDLFGVDVIGLNPGSPVLAIQITSG